MTDTTNSDDAPTAPADDSINAQANRSATEADASTGAGAGRNVQRYLGYALLAGLSLLALVAALQFYLNASSAINQWIADEYRSLFQAAFNLVVLLVAGAGITWQVSRLGNAR